MTNLAAPGSALGMTLPFDLSAPHPGSWEELHCPPCQNSPSEVDTTQVTCWEPYYLHQLLFIGTTMIRVTVSFLGQVNVLHHQMRKKNHKLDIEFVGKVAWVGSPVSC